MVTITMETCESTHDSYDPISVSEVTNELTYASLQKCQPMYFLRDIRRNIYMYIVYIVGKGSNKIIHCIDLGFIF